MGITVSALNRMLNRAHGDIEEKLQEFAVQCEHDHKHTIFQLFYTIPMPHLVDVRVRLPNRTRFLMSKSDDDKAIAIQVIYSHSIIYD